MEARLTIARVAPVLSLGPPARCFTPSEGQGPKVLAVTLADEASRGTLRWAARWAQLYDGVVHVLHVELAHPSRHPAARFWAARWVLGSLGAALPEDRLHLAQECLLREQIVATAAQIGAALIVLGQTHHRKSGPRGARLADQLGRALQLPVVLASAAPVTPPRPLLKLS